MALADQVYVLSADDVKVLQGLVQEARTKIRNVRNRPYVPEQLSVAPEVFVALTPAADPLAIPPVTGGIPALTFASGGPGTPGDGDLPGFADCNIYQVIDEGVGVGVTPTLRQIDVMQETVYNLSSQAIGADEWVLISRDKAGRWFISGPSSGGSGIGCINQLEVIQNDLMMGTGTGTSGIGTIYNDFSGFSGFTYNTVTLADDVVLTGIQAPTDDCSPWLIIQIVNNLSKGSFGTGTTSGTGAAATYLFGVENEDPRSLPQNQILTTSGGEFVVDWNNGAVTLFYDWVVQRWRTVSIYPQGLITQQGSLSFDVPPDGPTVHQSPPVITITEPGAYVILMGIQVDFTIFYSAPFTGTNLAGNASGQMFAAGSPCGANQGILHAGDYARIYGYLQAMQDRLDILDGSSSPAIEDRQQFLGYAGFSTTTIITPNDIPADITFGGVYFSDDATSTAGFTLDAIVLKIG